MPAPTDDFERCPCCHGRGIVPPLKQCANEKCRKMFRWQEGRASTDTRRLIGVLFCSAACANAQSTREWRRRNKATTEIRTGRPA